MTFEEKRKWKATKDKGVKLFAPEHGGSYEVSKSRPISDEIKQYCIQDVEFLPKLWLLYNSKLTNVWAKKVDDAIVDRILLSQSPTD